MKRFRSISLAMWLGFGSIAIVLVAVVGVALRSIDLLGEFADREGLTQAQLSSASAHEYLERVHDNVVTASRVLSRLPGLQRVLDLADPRETERYVATYCETSGMDACALIDGEMVFASSRDDFPWATAAAVYQAQGRKFMLVPPGEMPVLLGASSSVRPTHERLRTLVLKAIDARVLADMREQVGYPVRVTRHVVPPTGTDAWVSLHSAALEGRPVSARIEEPRPVYAASMPVPVRGTPLAFLDVEIEARSLDGLVRDLAARLGATALVIIGIAGLAGTLYGHWLVKPVTALGRAARQMGRGDLDTVVPAGGVFEVSELGTNLEDMRRSLVTLTATLRQREAETRAVLAGVVEGVFAVDMERRIRYANPQVSRLLDRDPDQIVGRFCGDVLEPELHDGVRPCELECPILAARESPGHGESAERLRCGSGKIKSMVIVSSAPDQGRQVQVLRDQTDIEAVRRARDSVLANISHEFRTPLAAQLASIEVLHDRIDDLTPAERLKVIHNLERGVLRLMRLVDNLLESVRIDAGQLTIREQPVALDEVIAECENLMQPLLAQRRQQLEVLLPPALPVILGDEQRLVQVFVNLFANAIKFAPEGSVIRVSGSVGVGEVAAWVEDEGPGIPEPDRSTVFEPFVRSMRGEPQAPGLGLGLWIVRSIVERHRGRIAVMRTSAGRTRFTITLPAESAA